MKAIGYTQSLPISHIESLMDIDMPLPTPTGKDLLVNVKAISVNPADYKVRLFMPPADGQPKVIGWDAVGEVVAVGNEVTNFKPGDMVFYAGDITRPGCNAEFQLVDERIVGHKPKSLTDAEAAALPLTAITAWELLFEHLAIVKTTPQDNTVSKEVILVVGAAGGVGSIFVQLAKTLTGATVIGTASRESSTAWIKQLGADYVIDHRKPLQPQIDELNIGPITHVASLNSTDSYFTQYTELLAPFGKIAMIDDPQTLDVSKLKMKSLSLHWEFMFARSMFNAADVEQQSVLLNRVAELVDQGLIKTTVGKNLGKINAANLRTAHEELETGKAIGKLVLAGF